MSQSMLDRITVEVLLPDAGNEAFILNESQLEGWLLADRDQAHQWVPIESEARLIETHRGGTLLDIASTMEVGTLTVQLVDPPQVRIRPSTPIRVHTPTQRVNLTLNPQARPTDRIDILSGFFADREWVAAPSPSPAGVTTAAQFTRVDLGQDLPIAASVTNLDMPFSGSPVPRVVRCAVMVDRPGLVAAAAEGAPVPLQANQWAHLTISADDAGQAILTVATEDLESPAEIGTRVWVTEIMSTPGTTPPGPYGDGDLDWWTWDGEPHASGSRPVGEIIFTGHVENQHTHTQRLTLTDTYTLTTITAVDAVNTLANTMRYGAVVETAADEDETPFDYETFEARADRLIRRTGLPYQIAPNEPITVSERLWLRDFLLPTQEAVETLWHTAEHVTLVPTPVFDAGERVGWFAYGNLDNGRTHHPGESYLSFPIHNLRPGSTYRITGTPAFRLAGPRPVGFGVVGIGHTVLDPIGSLWPLGEYEFTATATTHEVMITPGESVTVPSDAPEHYASLAPGYAPAPVFGGPAIQEMTLTLIEQRMPRGQDWFCQSIVYESNLVNHLDMCVNTVRGRWWVDRHGTVHFAREEGTAEPLLEFSDVPGAGLISYVDVEAAEDTARIVNTVTLQNNGRSVDPESGPLADNTTITAQDVTSVATNGPRGAEVPTSIYDPPFPELAHYGAGQELARSYTTAYATSAERISALRVHVTPELTEPMAALDVYDPINATHRDTLTEARVMSIAHTITPENWHTNLTLVER